MTGCKEENTINFFMVYITIINFAKECPRSNHVNMNLKKVENLNKTNMGFETFDCFKIIII